MATFPPGLGGRVGASLHGGQLRTDGSQARSPAAPTDCDGLGWPALGGADPGRSSARPRPEAEPEAGPERTERGGPGTRGGAGPHTGRGGWLGPLRSRRRLEEEARRLAEEGRRRRPRPKRRSLKTHFPGSAGKGSALRHPVPAAVRKAPPKAGRGLRLPGEEGEGAPGTPPAAAARGSGAGVRGVPGRLARAVGAAPPWLL